jgi:hypothetical protein
MLHLMAMESQLVTINKLLALGADIDARGNHVS